eukprot:14489172-Alexandrium_andersonii.AAC.1
MGLALADESVACAADLLIVSFWRRPKMIPDFDAWHDTRSGAMLPRPRSHAHAAGAILLS